MPYKNGKNNPVDNETTPKKTRKPRGQTISVRIFRMPQSEPTDPTEYFVFCGTKVKRHFQVDSDFNNPTPVYETDLGMMVRMGATFPVRAISDKGKEVAKLISTSPMMAEDAWSSKTLDKLIAKLHSNYIMSLIEQLPQTQETQENI